MGEPRRGTDRAPGCRVPARPRGGSRPLPGAVLHLRPGLGRAGDRTARLAAAAPRGEIKRYPVGHFEIYLGEPFERAVADQTEFLVPAS